MYDLRPFIDQVEIIVRQHALGAPGEYRRWLWQDQKEGRDLASSPYGCANAVNILYTIGRLPAEPEERAAFVSVLQSYQDPESGLFSYPGNYESHTTAFLAGALDLLDARPLYRAVGFEKYYSREALFAFLDQIDWQEAPWLGAHLGAGIYGSMVMTDTADDVWEDYYFAWLDSNADPLTGLWKKGETRKAPLFHYLAAAFHYVFNCEYARRAIPYPKELLNTCIQAYEDGECGDFATSMGWSDIDYTYLLAHVQRRAGERYEETQSILRKIAEGLIGQLLAADVARSEQLNDLNTLFALVSALAVLQEALPGEIRTSKPLRLVLDKRPFV